MVGGVKLEAVFLEASLYRLSRIKQAKVEDDVKGEWKAREGDCELNTGSKPI